ncbi:hypothetical protein PMAYCL1PPCAC_10534, partial [Pristionchus mayeri]
NSTMNALIREVEERMDVFDQMAKSIKSAAMTALNSRQSTDQVRALLAIYEIRAIRALRKIRGGISMIEECVTQAVRALIPKLKEIIDIFERY